MNGGDKLSGETFSDRVASDPFPTASNGSEPLQGVQYVQQALSKIQAQKEAFQDTARLAQSQHQHNKSQAAQQRQITRMRPFLNSGDPILVAEALAWAQVSPEVLQVGFHHQIE